MTTQYPNDIDQMRKPGPNDSTKKFPHHDLHGDAIDAIKAIQTKLGVDSSTDTESIDYRVTFLEQNGGPGGQGSVWYVGSGVPSDATGSDSDLYLDSANGDVYQKASGTWGSPVDNITGPQGVQGDMGPPGGVVLDYRFNISTTDENPTSGKIILNNATYSAVNQINISEIDTHGHDQDSFLDAIDVGDHIAIAKQGDGVHVSYIVTGTFNSTGNPGYDPIPVSWVDGDGTFANNDRLWISVYAHGPAGADGTVWREGTGAPNNATGVDGDFYLNDANGDVYQRAGGTYSVVANIKGPQGDTGAAGAAGTVNIVTMMKYGID